MHRAEEWTQHSWKWLYSLRRALVKRVAAQSRQSTRGMRVEQRRAISQLLAVIISHLDLKTMQLGYYHPETGTFIHLGIEYLARKAQLSPRRVQRALRWLHEAGYISAFRQSIYDDLTDTYLHKPSVRKIHNKLLMELGITADALNKARFRSTQRFQQNGLKRELKNQARTSHASHERFKNNLFTFIKNSSTEPRNNQLIVTYHEKLQKLMDHFPELSLEEAKGMLPRL